MNQEDNTLVFDFETLGTSQDSVILSATVLTFNSIRFLKNSHYEFEELVQKAVTQKYSVEEQVKNHGRKIDPETLEWWSNQDKVAKRILKPSPADVSIDVMPDLFREGIAKMRTLKRVYTRGTLDVILMHSVARQLGRPEFYPYYLWRDTRSTIEAITSFIGVDDKLTQSFIPREAEGKFVQHVPEHDVALDVMRLQSIMRLKLVMDS